MKRGSSCDERLMPIFVVGSGRSGTTLLFRLLAGHPDLAWISVVTNRFPRLPQLSALSRLPDSGASRFLGPSIESTRVYEYCGISPLLREKRASLTETDVTEASRARLRRVVWAHTKWMTRPRFINKNTNNTMRIRYLKEVFPDALFVHIIRSGYAVANSLNNVAWWPGLTLWWLGKTPRQWAQGGGNPLELCALHWKRQVQEILTHKSCVSSDRYFECRYEDLVRNPQALLRKIAAFCQLRWNQEFQEHTKSIAIESRNRDKWRKALDGASKEAVRRAAGDLLGQLGYEQHDRNE